MARKRNSKNRGCAATLQKNSPTEWKNDQWIKNPLVVFLSVGRCYSDAAYFLPEKSLVVLLEIFQAYLNKPLNS
jgi:hypothetical protein